MRVGLQVFAAGFDGLHSGGHGVFDAEGFPHEGRQALPCQTGEVVEGLTVPEERFAQQFRDGENDVAVGNLFQQVIDDPELGFQHRLLHAGWADPVPFARKRQDIGLAALRVRALDPGEAVPRNAAMAVFFDSVLDLWAEVAVLVEVGGVVAVLELVEVVAEQAVKGSFLGSTLFVDSGHASPYTRKKTETWGIFGSRGLTMRSTGRLAAPVNASVGPSRCAADSTAQDYHHAVYICPLNTIADPAPSPTQRCRLNTSYTPFEAVRAMKQALLPTIEAYRKGNLKSGRIYLL